jgi:hypothetical protein
MLSDGRKLWPVGAYCHTPLRVANYADAMFLGRGSHPSLITELAVSQQARARAYGNTPLRVGNVDEATAK